MDKSTNSLLEYMGNKNQSHQKIWLNQVYTLLGFYYQTTFVAVLLSNYQERVVSQIEIMPVGIPHMLFVVF